MGGLSSADAAQLQAHLQHAVTACSERCLWQSAKWAAELLNSLPGVSDSLNQSDTEVDSPMSDGTQSTPPKLKISVDPVQTQLEAKELPRYLLAKSFFDCREFDRCAAVFLPGSLPKGAVGSNLPQPNRRSSAGKGKARMSTPIKVKSYEESLSGISHKSLFLALYAKYISGEKRKDEDSEMILGPADGGVTSNKELNGLTSILEGILSNLHANNANGGGWLEYLYGIVLAKNKNEELAKTWLIKSVHLYPYNWGAWEELCNLLGTIEQLQQVTEQLPQNIMTYIFHIYASQSLFQVTDQVHNQLTSIQSIFPSSAFLKTQRALLFYHSKDFEESESIFSELLTSYPHRIDSVDVYSNILYVMSLRPKLAFLAHTSTLTDKFRPETCIVVGNYYSLLSQHEKAVIYFRRALTLDRTFTSAWTLMGHEYVEMKNSHAAIESYRRAVESNRRDYRAWYGLGQTYEVLEMFSYALWYYQRAAGLRPYDAKMWQAVGQCFAKVGKLGNALRAYKRALIAGSFNDGSASSFGNSQGGEFGVGHLGGGVLDPETLYQVASIYERLDQKEESAAYMELVLAQEEGPQADDEDGIFAGSSVQGVGVTPTTSKARMWLARYEFARGEYQRSMELANELCQDGVEVEDAKALVRDIRARVEADAG
ncbi:anaphase-promoting complex subunit CDC23 [Rhizodiscina lignyota]|uniref:Anaphase-promoting complex subunit CDC23 n=1 Tax=Rhizodiscina lignyota TaxID=1504668 RepID=A0A9P4I6H1_9PEZI|nr:anaphase-promoting complex subunit CDC23 [Rhizodiscina lignyota]